MSCLNSLYLKLSVVLAARYLLLYMSEINERFSRGLRAVISITLFSSAIIMVLASNLRPLTVGTANVIASNVIEVADFWGLTQGYQMFAVVGREGTDLKIEATNQDNEKIDLTKDLLFPDGIMDKILFYHKSGKFIHNIVLAPNTRQTYIDYLCRTLADPKSRPYNKILLLGSGDQFLRPEYAAEHHEMYGAKKVSLYLEKSCVDKAANESLLNQIQVETK